MSTVQFSSISKNGTKTKSQALARALVSPNDARGCEGEGYIEHVVGVLEKLRAGPTVSTWCHVYKPWPHRNLNFLSAGEYYVPIDFALCLHPRVSF